MKGASCSSEQVADGLIDRLWFDAYDCVWSCVYEERTPKELQSNGVRCCQIHKIPSGGFRNDRQHKQL